MRRGQSPRRLSSKLRGEGGAAPPPWREARGNAEASDIPLEGGWHGLAARAGSLLVAVRLAAPGRGAELQVWDDDDGQILGAAVVCCDKCPVGW